MPSKEYSDRTKQIVFGRESDERITRDEVGQYIRENMKLETTSGKPKWSEGICHLIELGMSERDAVAPAQEPESPDELREVRREKRRLENENESLRERIKALNGTTGSDIPNPAERQMEYECAILSVLCDDENMGQQSPNYVGVDTIAMDTDLDRSTVIAVLDTLSRRYPTMMRSHESKGKVKVMNPDLDEVHCHD